MNLRVEPVFLWLLLFVPISFVCAFILKNPILTFITAILSIIPLARVIGFATKELVLKSNPMMGGLVNATFGNIIELMIAIMALSQGLIQLVKASIIGSIIGNLLLLIGLSVFVGGFKYKEQKFNKDSVGVSSTMLIIAVAGLAIPTVYALTVKHDFGTVQILSDGVAIVLAIIYLAGLVFALFTHKHLFDASDEIKAAKENSLVSRNVAIIILLISTVFVAFESHLVVKYVEVAAGSLGFTQTFIGVVVIAIITNIAEKANAVHFSLENKLDVALEIGLSSAIQIALFVVPILMLISHFMGYGFSLVFSMFEIIAMVFAVMIINYLSSDGRCNWLEGAQLISVYLIIVTAFYFI